MFFVILLGCGLKSDKLRNKAEGLFIFNLEIFGVTTLRTVTLLL